MQIFTRLFLELTNGPKNGPENGTKIEKPSAFYSMNIAGKYCIEAHFF